MSSEWLKPQLTTELVRKLIAHQFPEWQELPVTPVASDGWDNTTFHLGDSMSVRLPSHNAYAAQVEKEQYWLPRLAQNLPMQIPVPIAKGEPEDIFPLPWSIYQWLQGESACDDNIGDRARFAEELAGFLNALRQVDTRGAPVAGTHNFYRGGALRVYDTEAREASAQLDPEFDAKRTTAVWNAALESKWPHDPVWIHGDIAAGNLLVNEGTLSGVIDFGCSGIGDPACDLVIAWTFLSGESRASFRRAIGLDNDTWARARGWAIWKAMIMLARGQEVEGSRNIIREVVAEHEDGT